MSISKLETARLLLRPFEEKDFEDLYEYLSDEEVVRYEPYEAMDREEVRICLEERIDSQEFIAMECKDTKKMIGNVYIDIRDDKCYELGYMLNAKYFRQGYASEACEEVVQWLFRNEARKVVCHCDSRNEASWKLLEKLRFKREEDSEQDTYVYGKLNPLFNEPVQVNGKKYHLVKLLGKGKGGYSYLAKGELDGKEGEQLCVVKQIHHEPCAYYSFGDKIQAEINDYEKLKNIGITIPKLIDVDRERERIVKEFISGDTIFEMVKNNTMEERYVDMMKLMCEELYLAGINIDYFPTNFIVRDNQLYYVDFECNGYMEEWNFENWGIKYWSRTKEFQEYIGEK